MSDRWEVRPVVQIGSEVTTVDADEEAEYFGLYYRTDLGLAQWHADFRTRELADAVAESLNLMEVKL